MKNGKHYKEFPKVCLGSSDIASLVLRDPKGVNEIHFGGDGNYYAYIVDETANIGEHYKLSSEHHHWLSIYDDRERTFRKYADVIKIYRAGEFGMIIKLIGESAKGD